MGASSDAQLPVQAVQAAYLHDRERKLTPSVRLIFVKIEEGAERPGYRPERRVGFARRESHPCVLIPIGFRLILNVSYVS